jgi:hypothetical protein
LPPAPKIVANWKSDPKSGVNRSIKQSRQLVSQGLAQSENSIFMERGGGRKMLPKNDAMMAPLQSRWPFEVAPQLADKSASRLVTRVGNVVVLFRPKPAEPPPG